MKKLKTSLLVLVLTSSIAVTNAQQKKDTMKTKEIEGVVVTALGIKRDEKSLSYANQTVKAKDLNLTQNVDVKNSIVGKVAGVQLNGQAGSKLGETGKLRLRGAVSLLNDADPIYVLDGVIVDPNTIDMDIVESVNVLKGPNATSLYGVRAQYGVIVMTTKKGSKSRLSIELNSTTTVDMVARTMKFQNLYGQGAAGNSSFKTFVFDPATMPAEWEIFNGKRHLDGDNNYTDESWGPRMDGQDYIPWYAWWKDSPYFGKTAKYEAQPNNVKDFYDKALTFKNTVSVSGGSDSFTARLSFTNLNQNGITSYTSLKRNYLNLNGTYKFNDRLSVDAIVNFSGGRVTGDFNDGYSNQTSGSFNQWFGRDLDMKKLKELQNLQTPEGYSASWNWWGPDDYSPTGYKAKPAFWINPYTWMKHFRNYTDRNTLLLSVAPSYRIADGLTARVSFSRTQNKSTNRYFMPNILAKNGSGTGSLTPGGYLTLLNGFGVRENQYTEDQYEGRLTYQKKFGEIDLTAIGGANITNRRWDGNSQVMDVTGTTQWLLTPDVFNFKNTNIPIIAKPYDYKQQYKSLYASASVGFKDTYFVEASVRNDINSAYLNSDNSFVSYSVGASLLLHNLLPKNDIVTYFKLRAGIAQIPADLTATLTNPEYRNGNQPLAVGNNLYQTAWFPTRIIGKGLKPALNDNKEIGVDLKFLKNRLSFGATYYDETRKNEPIPVTLASSSGKLDVLINSANAKRKGIELALSGDIFRNDNGFSWTTSINWARNKSTISKVNENLESIQYGDSNAFNYVSILQKEGLEWGQLYGTGIKRDVNGNPVINSRGLYEYEPNKAFGSILPEFTGGFYNTFSYKGISLGFTIDFQKGGKFFSLSEQWGNSGGLLEETAAMNDRGHNVRDAVADGGGVRVTGVDNTGAPVDMYVEASDYFKQFHANRIAEPFIHNASYIKLREIAVNYQLPRSLFANTGISNMSIGLTARNPWLISVSKDNKHRLDPSELSQNFGEDGQLPSTRGFGVNVKINF
ncbi:SusC/RagA family TonB-linked outer membrane protein [Chryseobacterium gallinarum]|uniref:SusC/RagA family TonB-linked outer membrane protein n=1 Tax=Chryseobacterium gallinarum TaxID=1324352 RepID=A0ABX6KUQ6_CHRGL|nr:SusC/RagA family TonB-linked outer membrane protein [Chryseobacterium gallinarum]QIY92341.1 SusC/RagA family TonB-linked outer membrane protein [Chryseobacterium gallinarum]